MTETDLVTAGGSAEQAELPNTVNSEDSSPATLTRQSPRRPRTQHRRRDVTTDASAGSLSTMVLPELRALANSVGVKGASGMRKSELIAAIRESRGESRTAPPRLQGHRQGRWYHRRRQRVSACRERGRHHDRQRRARRAPASSRASSVVSAAAPPAMPALPASGTSRTAARTPRTAPARRRTPTGTRTSRTPSRTASRTAVTSRATSRVAATTTAKAARDAVADASATAGAAVNAAPR